MFKIAYQWQCIKKNGSVCEGGYSAARRIIGILFLGERFKRLRNARG